MTQDPSASKLYGFDWGTSNLPPAVVVNTHSFSITGVNAIGATLNLTVTSLVYDAILTVTVTTATAHGYVTGDYITMAGVVPWHYNVTDYATVTGANTFTYQLGGAPPVTSTTGVTASKGLDQVSILTGAPYNSRYTQFRFTPNGFLGGQFEIANRIVTSETPSQTKELSFRILVQNL